MKLVTHVLLSILVFFLIALGLGYLTLKSHWGITTACRWISEATPYHLSIQKMSYSGRHPLSVSFHEVTFGEDGKPALLIADQVTLGLQLGQLLSPYHFAAITLEKGSIILSNLTPETSLPVSADHLQLQEVKLFNPYTQESLSAQAINAQISPWQPTTHSIFGEVFDFSFSAKQVNTRLQQFDQLTAVGHKSLQQLQVHHFSGAVAQGRFSGEAIRNAHQDWKFPTLRLENIRFQTTKNPQLLLQPLMTQGATIDDLSLQGISVLGANWAVNNLSAQGQNIAWDGADYHRPQGTLSLQADSVVSGIELFERPQLKIEADSNQICFPTLSTSWSQGSVTAQGCWARSTDSLHLSQVTVKNIRYTLPSNWQTYWRTELPAWLATLTLDHLAVDNTLLIDTNADFPFQMTGLHISGDQLQLVRQHQWGVWTGRAEYYAPAATFNRQDIRAPWFSLQADNEKITLEHFKVLVGEGAAEGNMTIEQAPTRHYSLALRAEKVPYNALNHWGWPTVLTEQGDFTLQLQGQISTLETLQNSTNGLLTLQRAGVVTQQHMLPGKQMVTP